MKVIFGLEGRKALVVGGHATVPEQL